MRRTLFRLLTVLCVGAAAWPAQAAEAQLFYHGDPGPDAYTSAINIPNAEALSSRAASGFRVQAGSSWRVEGLFANAYLADPLGLIEHIRWEIRTGVSFGSAVGSVLHTGASSFSRTETAFPQATRVELHTLPALHLSEGDYWLTMFVDLAGTPGIYGPNGTNFGIFETAGTNASGANALLSYWLLGETSSAEPSFSSPRSGFSMGIRGKVVSTVPEPDALSLMPLGIVGIALLLRRRAQV